MVRRIRACGRCNRHFTATSAKEATCPKCCRQQEELSAVLPRNGFSPLPAVDSTDSMDVDCGKLDTQDLPVAKRPNPAISTGDDDDHSSACAPIAHATSAAATTDPPSSESEPSEDSDSDDPDAHVPLAILFGEKKTDEEDWPRHPVSNTTPGKLAHAQTNQSPDHSMEDYRLKSDEGTKEGGSARVSTGGASDPIVLDDSQDTCEADRNNKDNTASAAQTDGDDKSNKALDSILSSDNDDESFPVTALSDDACFICGSDLTKLTGSKGRLNHLKRCSKRHGVSARDFKLNDDSELFLDSKPSATNDTSNQSTSSSWHAGAATDLALADHRASAGYKENTVNQKLPVAAPGKSKQTTMGNFFKMPVRSLNNVLLAGARRMAKSNEVLAAQKTSTGGGGKQKRKRIDYSKLSCPQYKKIPGTDFVCDGFMYAKSSLTKTYFLTHFHSDHYGGITKNWNAGIIYCSLETANLVHEKLGVDRKYLHPLGLMTPTVVESNGRPVSVTLMDANHCPGAVMFLFEVGKRRILHVGDFRWNRERMTQYPPIRAFASMQYRLDDLFLDTTYCDEKYTLPSQAEAIEAAVEIAEKEWNQSKARGRRALFLFGAYTIGKERIYLSVAERLRCKVYVENARYKTLRALNWPKERMSMLTINKEDTNLWVVPLGHINFKNMQSYLGGSDKVFSKKKYDCVVGFRPTGWTHSAKTSSGSIVNSQTRGSFTVHGVPYSEHSSFNELVDCLDCLKPRRIIPTVSASKSQEQVDLLLRHLRKKQGR